MRIKQHFMLDGSRQTGKTKSIIFCIIGLCAVAGNFFLEGRLISKGEQIETGQDFSNFSSSLEHKISDNGIIRLADTSQSGFINSIEASGDLDKKEYVFNVASGKIWGNFLISNANVNIVAGKLVFIPNHAVFDLEYDGKKAVLNVFNGDVYVGFLDDGVLAVSYNDEYSDLFVNKLLVARENQITIRIDKLDEKIKSLLYSKLVKEFKYMAIPTSLTSSSWVLSNQEKDRTFVESVKQNLLSALMSKGLTANNSSIGDFIFWLKENLTFMPDQKQKVVFDHLFGYLDDAINHVATGNEVLSNSLFGQFEDYLLSLPESATGGDEFSALLDKYIDKSFVFSVDNKIYSILQKLLDKKFYQSEITEKERYGIVNLFWLKVYDGLDSGSVFAEEALKNYYKYFDVTTDNTKNSKFYRDYLTYQNQLLDNLFIKWSDFYKEDYFVVKDVLERDLLKLYDEGQMRTELTQALISNKIAFLKRLMRFFFEDELSVDNAKKIVSMLIEEINNLMPKEKSDAAVIKLFQSQLDDIGNFWGYLNSPEYNISKTYGATQEDRYKAYLEDKDKIWSYINVQNDILGKTDTEQSVADIRTEINNVFQSNADISDFELGVIENAQQRFVKVNGIIGGYPFEAQYDRERVAVKDVNAYGQLVSDRSVKLDKLLDLLKGKFADVKKDDSQVQYTEETFAQRAAKIYISEKIKTAGFIVTLDDVSIIDELGTIYSIKGIHLNGYDDVIATFDFVMNTEKVKNVVFSVKGNSLVFDGIYRLDELKSLVVAESDLKGEGKVLR